jgi:RNA-binding protein
MLSSEIKRSIKKNVSAQKPTIWVGKDGSTDEIVSEIDRQLEQRGAVKAKILNTALKSAEAKEIAIKIANQTGATLIEVRGHTFILYRKRNKTKT